MSPDPSLTITEITIVGANCSWCIEQTVDALRAEPGVTSARTSATGGCLSVEHRSVGDDRLLAIVRDQLHGYDVASAETVMVEVDPQIAALHCTHGHPDGAESTDPSPVPATPRMETILEASARLREDGYLVDFTATPQGQLRCESCGTDHDPATVVIDHIVRYEGASNPDDQSILLALRCGCGSGGLFLAPFGPSAGAADAAVLRRLP